jgi:outer membrane cobalamin receptor
MTLISVNSPVQQTKRIEITKGPDSSSWGPAMGWVVNIVTKYPIEEARLGGPSTPLETGAAAKCPALYTG